MKKKVQARKQGTENLLWETKCYSCLLSPPSERTLSRTFCVNTGMIGCSREIKRIFITSLEKVPASHKLQ